MKDVYTVYIYIYIYNEDRKVKENIPVMGWYGWGGGRWYLKYHNVNEQQINGKNVKLFI